MIYSKVELINTMQKNWSETYIYINWPATTTHDAIFIFKLNCHRMESTGLWDISTTGSQTWSPA